MEGSSWNLSPSMPFSLEAAPPLRTPARSRADATPSPAGAPMFTFTVTNGGTITGNNGSGVNIDGLTSTTTVMNLAAGSSRETVLDPIPPAIPPPNVDGDGVDVDGVLTLINEGTVQGLEARGLANNSEGVAAGGGTITNLAGGVIKGEARAGDPALEGRGILVDDGSGRPGVATTTVTNAGEIRGFSGFAVKLVGNFADRIDNQAGGVIPRRGHWGRVRRR